MRGWSIAATVTLLIILGPFLVLGRTIDVWLLDLLSREPSWIALLIISVLALDSVLPIPSSIVSVAAGATLGFPGGWLSVWLGMSLGSLIGYGLGRHVLGRAIKTASTPSAAEAHWSATDTAVGAGMILATRAIPVLAEAATILVGFRGMPVVQYLAVALAANAIVAWMYAAAGAWASDTGSIWIILAVTLALTLPPWIAYRRLRRRLSIGGRRSVL